MKVFEDINNIGLSPEYNKFDLSHTSKLSMNAGTLYPVTWIDCIPGQKLRINPQVLIRTAKFLAPTYTKIRAKINFYYVPYSLVWENFPKWINGVKQDSILPQIEINESTISVTDSKSLGDFLGLRIDRGGDTWTAPINISQIPFRVYQKIWHDIYRNQNLVDELNLLTDDTLINANTDNGFSDLISLRRAQWEKDYFTSAVYEPQFGNAIGIPVEFDYLSTSEVYDSVGGTKLINQGSGVLKSNNSGNVFWDDDDTANSPAARIQNLDTNAVQFTIEQLRWNIKLQMWSERIIRAGRRYKDYLWSTFKVKSSDARLDLPEFVGGLIVPIQIGEIASTDGTNTGDLKGNGIGSGNNVFTYECEEHGMLMGIMHIVPEPEYNTINDKFWFKTDKFDFFTPDFAQVGYQEIQKKELYANLDETADENDELFGYIPRYSEYKFMHNKVSGEFRTNMKHYSWFRPFDTTTVLEDSFVDCQPNYDCFAVTSGASDHFYTFINFNIDSLSPVPYFNVPQL